MTQEIYISALDWLGRGFSLLPVIPGTKYIVKGFEIATAIKDQAVAARYFRDSLDPFNLAVVSPAGTHILDFDDWDLYLRWLRFVKPFDDSMTRTYTELTPAGGVHVFLSGDIPPGYRCRKGCEIKRHSLVAPSVLASGRYEVFADLPIYQGSLDAVFFFLSEPCTDQSAVLLPLPGPRPGTLGRIDQIKGRLPIVEMFKSYYPKATLKQRGVFYNCLCPFHADKNPSFWLNSKLNIFGCHTCKARGDVINLYALIRDIDNEQAIKDLMAYAF